MMRLYHFPLSPFGRKVRMALAEKRLEAELIEEAPWRPSRAFAQIAPGGETPALVIGEGAARRAIADSTVIIEYLEETAPARKLLPEDSLERAEARRLSQWFDLKFHREVTVRLVNERIYKRLAGSGSPDSAALRAGAAALRPHLDYLSGLLDQRQWLAGEELTIADFAAAAQFSSIDYTGDVPWAEAPLVKEWYALMKSRPSMRGVLADRAPGMPPWRDYADPDF